MNTRKNKSTREENLQILQFLMAQNFFQFRDRPDFIIDFNGQKTAIEHTRLLRDRTSKGSLERQQESITDQIIEETKALYVTEKHYNLRVSITFNPILSIKQLQIPNIAQTLCNCIRELESTVIHEGYTGPFDWRANYSLENKIPDVISHFWIEQATYTNDLWSVSDGGTVGHLKPELIQVSLNDKEKKIPEYKSKCDILWILVVASGHRMSSYFDSDNEDFLKATYVSSADAVYLLDSFANKVHQLLIKSNI